MGEPVGPSEEDIDELELLTRPGREEDLRTFLLLLHPADVAEMVGHFSETTAKAILRHLDREHAADLLSELEPHEKERILSLIRPEEVGPIVKEMETDDVTDLLQELDEVTAKHVLAVLPAEEQKDVTELLKYDPDTAGGIMQTELVSVPVGSMVGTALAAVRNAAKQKMDIISVFVVDDLGRYTGHIALQDLVLSSPQTPVEVVVEPKVVQVTPDIDQEEVAKIFDHYSLVELGVVDAEEKLVGRITADDIHEVLLEEAEEDMLKVGGTAAEPEVIYSGKVLRIVLLRLPWLISTFIATLIATYILHSASTVFETVVILLMFVPVITGMSGNVGTQSAMIMISGMALGHIDSETLFRSIVRDIMVSAVMAVVCGGAAVVIIGLWQSNYTLGLCVGSALACSMVTASILGSVEPAVLKRFGIDPAVAAGPLITSINDISGVIIYTMIALLFLQHLQ